MRELTGDPIYEMLKAYDRCMIDYCLIESDSVYCGCRSHREAIRFSMDRIWERYRQDWLLDTDEEPLPWTQDPEKAKAEQIDPKGFLTAPDVIKKSPAEGQIPYWYAFLCAPHGTGYDPQDFKKINEKLFPKGAESLEIFQWTTDWSTYFDAGREWWGTACWSVYDRALNRFVVILASATD